MAPLCTSPRSRRHWVGASVTPLKRLLLLPVLALALAPGVMGSPLFPEASAGVSLTRHTVSAPTATGSFALGALSFVHTSDQDGGPPRP